MEFKVIVAIRHDGGPWDFTAGPVAEFIDEERAVRFAKSEVRSGWDKERVRVVRGRRLMLELSYEALDVPFMDDVGQLGRGLIQDHMENVADRIKNTIPSPENMKAWGWETQKDASEK